MYVKGLMGCEKQWSCIAVYFCIQHIKYTQYSTYEKRAYKCKAWGLLTERASGHAVVLWCACLIPDLIKLLILIFVSDWIIEEKHSQKLSVFWWGVLVLPGPSDVTLTVFVNETAGLRPVWNTSGYMNRTWIQDRVDYSASGPHQVKQNTYFHTVIYLDTFSWENTAPE